MDIKPQLRVEIERRQMKVFSDIDYMRKTLPQSHHVYYPPPDWHVTPPCFALIASN